MANFTALNPFDNTVVCEFTYTTTEQIDKILAILQRGKKQQLQIPYFQRAEILEKLADLVGKNSERLAKLITREVGKTISDSRVELQRAQNSLLCAASETRNIKGEALHSDAYSPKRERIGIVQWYPLGTVLAITPFNFPVNIAIHKIAPAFAAGNAILFKPGPQNYQSGKEIVNLCYQAGIPETVLQMAVPDIPAMTNLVADPRINCINFTGGTQAGYAIAKNAGFKKLLFELGGNDPLIVMPDADIELAVTTAIQHRFGTAGQRCTACKRVFIHEEIYENFKQLLLTQTEKLNVGDPMEDATFVGPLVSKQAADSVWQRISGAVSEGATVLCGNTRDNNIIHPTILENVNLNSDLVAQETFGPVMPLFKFTDIGTVISTINSSPYGLQSSIFTQNLALIKKLYAELQVGAVVVNDGSGFRAEHFPFGGIKESGIGREGLFYAIREMSYQKMLVL